MRKPKKPKALKKPKANASLDALKAYMSRVQEQEKNYKAKLKEYEDAKKMREKVRAYKPKF